MRIHIDKLVPNPFRNFEIDPIDLKQVARLAASIDDLGFFSGITARPIGDGWFQIAAGHHRWEAAKMAKQAQIEAVVDTYTDEEMVRIMAIENLTQRGANTGAQMDAVGAMALIVSYDILSDRAEVATLIAKYGLKSQMALDVLRGKILTDGPGERVLYQAINGFNRDDAESKEEPHSVMIGSGDVKNAVKRLKDSGLMAKIVGFAFTRVEKERAEDEEKRAEQERKAEAKRKAEEERAAAELKRKQEAEAEAVRRAEEGRRAAEAARKAAERAAAEQKAAAEKKAAEAKAAAERAQKEREAAAKTRREAEAVAEQKRKDEAKRKAEAARQRQARLDQEDMEREKVKAQQERERVYDARCDQLFPDPSFANVFYKAVTSIGSLDWIKRDQQLGLATAIVKEAADWKKFSDHKLGTEFINQFVNEYIRDKDGERKESDAKAKAAMEAVQARLRVDRLWGDVKSGVLKVNFAMEALVAERQKWNTASDGDFPIRADITDIYGILERLEKMMRLMYGGAFGIPEEHNNANSELKRIGRN